MRSGPAERRQAIKLITAGVGPTEVSRRLGVSRSTLHRWRVQYDQLHPVASLRPRSSRPHHVRQPTWTEEDLIRLANLEMNTPGASRRQLRWLLWPAGGMSEATVARMLRHMRSQGCPICGGRSTHDEVKHIVHGSQAPRKKPRRGDAERRQAADGRWWRRQEEEATRRARARADARAGPVLDDERLLGDSTTRKLLAKALRTDSDHEAATALTLARRRHRKTVTGAD